MKHQRALTTREVAELCSVSFYTVIRWIERGELNAYKPPGRGDYRITLENFISFSNQKKIPIPQELMSTHKKVLVIDDDTCISDEQPESFLTFARHLRTQQKLNDYR